MNKTILKNLCIGLTFILALACKKADQTDVLEKNAKSTSVVSTVNAVTGITTGSISIVPLVRSESPEYKESSSYFECPNNTVMTGRWHNGDENGKTKYEYATLQAVDNAGQPIEASITVEEKVWSNYFKESSGAGFTASAGRVIIGRQHSGDENGNTRYLTGIVKYNGKPTQITNVISAGPYKESNGTFYKTNAQQVIISRIHQGDENKYTNYQAGTIVFNYSNPNANLFRVVVRLHPTEEYFPMNPTDFIKSSRFRHMVGLGSDQGWDKTYSGWRTNNDHTAEYYDIPVYILNNFGLLDGKNRRPRDDNKSDFNVFLEPDDNLVGEPNPNGKVSSFTYQLNDGRKQFWLFYGYNYSNFGFSLSHQGDWESVTLQVIDDNITGAWLSAHGNDTFYKRSDLIVETSGNIQTLYVYSARGTHANYSRPGDWHTLGSDHAADGGYQWVVSDKTEDLETAPWRDYAGAWGEVGEVKDTTGPLGPWYKKIQ
jgi:hypothetical protein